LRHALLEIETQEPTKYDFVLLLDPTSPAREPEDVSGALAKLQSDPDLDGVIGVSQPDFNPMWTCVVERNGRMAQLVEEGREYDSRQEVPTVYRINGSVYIWRAEFMRREECTWRRSDDYAMYEIPEYRAMSFDSLSEFQRAEVLVKSGLVNLPWLSEVPS